MARHLGQRDVIDEEVFGLGDRRHMGGGEEKPDQHHFAEGGFLWPRPRWGMVAVRGEAFAGVAGLGIRRVHEVGRLRKWFSSNVLFISPAPTAFKGR